MSQVLFMCTSCTEGEIPELLRVDVGGEPWCEVCWNHQRDEDEPEWNDLPAFVPPYAAAVAFLDDARAAPCDLSQFCPDPCGKCWPCLARKRAADAGVGEVTT